MSRPADLDLGEWQPCGLAIAARFWLAVALGSVPVPVLVLWWLS